MNFRQPSEIFFCDWGTSALRLQLVDGSGKILAETKSSEGIAKIAASTNSTSERKKVLKATLLAAIRNCQDKLSENASSVTIICSGMLSSSIGWQDLPYSSLPFALDGSNALAKHIDTLTIDSFEFPLVCISGVASDCDVMRGEEVQLVGLFNSSSLERFQESCLLILPGTHSKHCKVRENSLESFQSYMTGELYQVIGSHSVLKHSLDSDFKETSLVDLEWFNKGVVEVQDCPLSGSIFRIRARSLRDSLSRESAKSYLSGMLLGAELSALKDITERILLAASSTLEPVYTTALSTLGLEYHLVPAKDLEIATRAGQKIIFHNSSIISNVGAV